MSQNVKKIDIKPKTQPARDIEEIMEKSRKKDPNDNEEGLESDEERIRYIRADLGL